MVDTCQDWFELSKLHFDDAGVILIGQNNFRMSFWLVRTNPFAIPMPFERTLKESSYGLSSEPTMHFEPSKSNNRRQRWIYQLLFVCVV
jgi:hypothetical protein